MDNQELIDEVEKWKLLLTDSEPKLIELAFFKIFIKFEKFLSNLFIHYSIGSNSVHSYCPNRKLKFDTQSQLDDILGNKRTNFINYFESVFKLSSHIFDENSSIVKINQSDHSSEILKIKTLRDYIAHESDASKEKYMNSLTNGVFMEPYLFLIKKKNRGTSITNYSYYVDKMVMISDFVLKEPV